jgi:hypothetical protein
VLLNRDTAEGIAIRSITHALRCRHAPRAKAGGTQRTVAGTIRIEPAAQRWLAIAGGTEVISSMMV